jgi:hypothetical protein
VDIVKRDSGDIMKLQRDMLDLKASSGYKTDIAHASSAPAIDGALNDVCWKNAQKLVLKQRATLKTLNSTKADALLAWDKKNLYIAFLTANPEIPMPSNFKSQWDSGFEVDIAHDNAQELIRISISREGNVECEKVKFQNNLKSSRQKISLEVNGKVMYSNGLVFSEIAVPFESIGIKPEMGNSFRINLGMRQKINYRAGWHSFGLLSWAPVSPVRNWLSFGVVPDALGKAQLAP